jgi:hypothetical protein
VGVGPVITLDAALKAASEAVASSVQAATEVDIATATYTADSAAAAHSAAAAGQQQLSVQRQQGRQHKLHPQMQIWRLSRWLLCKLPLPGMQLQRPLSLQHWPRCRWQLHGPCEHQPALQSIFSESILDGLYVLAWLRPWQRILVSDE